MKNFLITLFLCVWTGSSFSQEIIKKTSIPFQIEIEKLIKGDIQYAAFIKTASNAQKKWTWAKDFDTVYMFKKKDIAILMSKFAYVVNKPIGFFDHTHLSDERYIAHLAGDQKVIRLSESSFKMTVPGEEGHSYQMDAFFDSDDISTLTRTKIIHAVTSMKKIDTISQSASSTVFKEFTNHSDYLEGSVQIVNFVALKENKTLVITYQMSAIKKALAKNKDLEKNLIDENIAQKNLIESFR